MCCQWRHADGVPGGDLSHGKTACEPASQGGGGGGITWYNYEFHAIGDSSPANTLLKQEGLQFAEASFRDNHQLKAWTFA